MSTLAESFRQQQPEQSPPAWLTQDWLEPRLVAVTALAIAASFIGEALGVPPALDAALGIIAYVAGGFYGLQTALHSLLVERKLDVDLLMILAALGAASIGAWHEGAVLLFLFSLSNVLQDYAIGRSRNAIRGLFDLYPEEARVKTENGTVVRPFEDISIDDVILIEPGERIPVDGVVLRGESSVDEAPITGESVPVDKAEGDQVFAGTLNKQGALDVRATKTATDNTLSRIITLVEEAQENQAPTERFLDRFEQYYAGTIILAIIAFIIIPPAVLGVNFEDNF